MEVAEIAFWDIWQTVGLENTVEGKLLMTFASIQLVVFYELYRN